MFATPYGKIIILQNVYIQKSLSSSCRLFCKVGPKHSAPQYAIKLASEPRISCPVVVQAARAFPGKFRKGHSPKFWDESLETFAIFNFSAAP